VADTSLYLPDYSAQERTYQLLRQVIGRVGRGHRPGAGPERVIIQAYDPDSPVIKAAASGSWDDFYNSELDERRMFGFPPFVYTLKLSVRRASAASAEKAAQKVADELRASGLRLMVDGPMPALHEKHGDKYQWQLVCKSKDRPQLVQAIGLLPTNWSYDIDPNNLL
jgi:primosomal protein N' (replication factor Y)